MLDIQPQVKNAFGTQSALPLSMGYKRGSYLEHIEDNYGANTGVMCTSSDTQAGNQHASTHTCTAEEEELTTSNLIKEEPNHNMLVIDTKSERS